MTKTLPTPATFKEPVMTKHKWSYCDLCESHITLCGTCGNNVCNAGSGTVDDKPCPDCESSYQEWIANPEKVQAPKQPA